MSSNIRRAVDRGNTADSDWDAMFAKLLWYRKRNGHTKVPRHYSEDMRFAVWVAEIRKDFRLYAALKTSKDREELHAKSSLELTPAQFRALEDIGFETSNKNPRHLRWDFRFQQLKEFKAKYGHTQVPIQWEPNIKLANWISTQRQEYKNLQKGRSSQLTEQRIQLLEEIGFAWEVQRGGRRRQLKPVSPEESEDGIVPGKTIVGRIEASPVNKRAVKEDRAIQEDREEERKGNVLPSGTRIELPQLRNPSLTNSLPNPMLQQELDWQKRRRQAIVLEHQRLARSGQWQQTISQSVPLAHQYHIPPATRLWGYSTSPPLIGCGVGGLMDFSGNALAAELMLSNSRKRFLDAPGPGLVLPFTGYESRPALVVNLSNLGGFESSQPHKRRKSDPPAQSQEAGEKVEEWRAGMPNSQPSETEETRLKQGSGSNQTTSPPKSLGSLWKRAASVEPRGRGANTNISNDKTPNGYFATAATRLGQRRESLQQMNQSLFEDAENDDSL